MISAWLILQPSLERFQRRFQRRSGRCLVTVLAVLAGMCITVYCYYPGYMSYDSLYQFTQGQTGVFDDTHPPLMSFIWGFISRVIPGPAGMLIFDNILFWSGLGIIVSDLFGHNYRTRAMILIIGIFPPITALLSTIWKDVAMGTSLVFATAMFFHSQRVAASDTARSNAYCGFGLLATFYALATRINALPAVTPLVFWGTWILVAANSKHFLIRRKLLSSAFLCTLLLVAMLVAASGITRLLVKGKTVHRLQALLLHDLVAISVETNTMLLPEYLMKSGGRPMTIEDLKRIYNPANCDMLFMDHGPNIRTLPSGANDHDLKLLTQQWMWVVRRYPGYYLLHRWTFLEGLLNLKEFPFTLIFYEGIDSNPYGFKVHQSWLNRHVMRELSTLRSSILFKNWLYLVLTVVEIIVAFLIASQHLLPICVLGTSGILNTMQYFFIGATPDFRYNWWSICASILILCFIVAASPPRVKWIRLTNRFLYKTMLRQFNRSAARTNLPSRYTATWLRA